jgi:putative addiction module component (TIGR02574 family)
MNQRVKALVDEARKLTPDEQWDLLRQLHQVVDDDETADGTPEEIEAAWMEEVERRAAAVERGESQLVDADVVFARIQARLVAAKKSDV